MDDRLKVMITGARGMLGRDLCSVLEADYDIYGFDIEDFDVVEESTTLRRTLEVSPDVIFHLAAYTDVDGSEVEQQRAFNVNAIGTRNMAQAARNAAAYLIYLSTDYVFDGNKTQPYDENDEPNPVNYYGLTKFYGELYVRELTLHHLVVRTSWLFGPNGKNFIDTILAKAETDGYLRVVSDQQGCPTYTLHLARALRDVMERRLEGVIHLTNSGSTTWYDLAVFAVESAGIDADIEPVSSQEYPTKARRPAYSVLSSTLVGANRIAALPHWQEGVKHHLRRKNRLKKE